PEQQYQRLYSRTDNFTILSTKLLHFDVFLKLALVFVNTRIFESGIARKPSAKPNWSTPHTLAYRPISNAFD
ncbi:hypothetical protein, partial [Dickeya undicola]|uniref:hypothetical protein n=1 Tax=Dickeya undicola TaxID=1577887 RepID=UPI001F422898